MTSGRQTPERLYLDHNARSPLRPEARAAMIAALTEDGNPSSVHHEGRRARRLIDEARDAVAALIGAAAGEIVFTSGATEANNLALGGHLQTFYRGQTFYRADIEHESVLAPIEAQNKRRGADVVRLPVDREGVVDADVLRQCVKARADADRLAVLSLQLANNETGVLQDVPRAAAIVREAGRGAARVVVHCDAVQAAGRLAVDFRALDADLMSLSSHKIGGPMGVGALVVRDGFDVEAMMLGGGQERRRRSGTENVAAIAGFGAAARAASRALAGEQARLGALRDDVERIVRAAVPRALIIGAGAPRLSNTVCVALPGTLAETTVIKLDLAGVAISAGAACSSGKVGVSHVLSAMGYDAQIARTAVRISVGWNTTASSLEEFSTRFRQLVAGPTRAVA